jgi:hypothetical protein
LIQDSATEAALQSSNDFGQVQLLRLHETLFAQTMVRVCIDPMMSGAQRDRGEVRALLPQSSWPKTFVWAASITVAASLTLEQTTHPSLALFVSYKILHTAKMRDVMLYETKPIIELCSMFQ